MSFVDRLGLRTRLRPGHVVVLREQLATAPGRGWPARPQCRVVGAGIRGGEVEVELIGVGSAAPVFSFAGSGERASLPRAAVRRVFPESASILRRFD
jgi:hypothetical protein